MTRRTIARKKAKFARVVRRVVTLGLCMAVAGCVVLPTRMTTRRYGSGGVGLRGADVDTTFIKPGVTSRDEIAARLRAIDVNSPSQIFWGRWVESSWGVVAGSLPPLSTNSDPAAGSSRHWHCQNLLIKFDDQGIATEMQKIDNDEALWRQLLAYTRNSPGPAVGDVLEISSNNKKYTRMILTAHAIELQAANPKDRVVIDLPGFVVIRLHHRFEPAQALNTPELTCFQAEIMDARARVRRSFGSCAPARLFINTLAFFDRLTPPSRVSIG